MLYEVTVENFLPKLESVIQQYLKETYLPPHRAKTPGWNWHDIRFFSEGAAALSEAFTSERSTLPKNYLNKKEYRSAYLMYFTLTNAAKVWYCLERAKQSLPNRGLNILDVGCGPATAALACSAFFSDRPLTIVGVDQNKSILKDGYGLWNRMKPPANHKLTLTPTLSDRRERKFTREKFDLAIAANVLSEQPEQQLQMATALLEQAKVVILIEPALQKTTRELMKLRDELLHRQTGTVLAPCLHQQDCPMLKFNNRDWCHFYINWQCPKLIRDVDHFIGNKHDYLKMAYMIFSGGVAATTQKPKNRWRVVSSQLKSKGKTEWNLCGDDGRLQKMQILDKEFEKYGSPKIRRGDVIQLPLAVHKSGYTHSES